MTTVAEKKKSVNTEQGAHEYCQETLRLKKNAETLFLAIGERLHQIRMRELYKPFWSSFEEYCMEFKWEGSTASRLINIYKKFVLEYHIAPAELVATGGWTVLAEVLPVVKNKEDAVKWVRATQELSRADVRREIATAKRALPEDLRCRHPESKATYIRICECGCKEQIYDVDYAGRKS